MYFRCDLSILTFFSAVAAIITPNLSYLFSSNRSFEFLFYLFIHHCRDPEILKQQEDELIELSKNPNIMDKLVASLGWRRGLVGERHMIKPFATSIVANNDHCLWDNSQYWR